MRRLTGAGGKKGAANARLRKALTNFKRFLAAAASVGLLEQGDSEQIFPIHEADTEALIYWLHSNGEPTAANDVSLAFKYASGTLKLPVGHDDAMAGGIRPRALKLGTCARDASPPLLVAFVVLLLVVVPLTPSLRFPPLLCAVWTFHFSFPYPAVTFV